METQAADYARIKSAIRFIETRAKDQPSLEAIAAHLGLSPFHFQRLFSRWAGVSPKKFLEFITVQGAKKLLDQSASVLDAALDLGLSGPSRLHDMFVQIEALSPGEYKSMGQGLALTWGTFPSPFGPCLIAESPRGVCALEFFESPASAEAQAEQTLAMRWSNASLVRDEAKARALGERIFYTPRSLKGADPLRLLVKGSAFQVKVWKGLLSIPEGRIVSYGKFAEMIGQEGAARAVGSAIGGNPIGYLIPCHRVLRTSGEFGGYKWGLERKKALIAREASRALLE